MIKRIIQVVIFIISLSVCSFAATDIQVYLDNNKINLAGKAEMDNGRVLVPMRSIFEAIGASVNWNASSNLVTSVKGTTKVALQIDNKNMGLNGKLVEIDVAPKLVSGRTLVPVRVISESFGYKVDWDSEKNIVYIKSNGSTSTIVNNTPKIEVIDSFNWVDPNIVLSYYEVTPNGKVFKTTTWNEPINKEITIKNNDVSFVQCVDEIDFRNKVFSGYGYPFRIPQYTKVTLLKLGQMYPDTLFVSLADGRQGVIYQTGGF